MDNIIKRLIKLDHEIQDSVNLARTAKDDVQRDARSIENEIFMEHEQMQLNDLSIYKENMDLEKLASISKYKENYDLTTKRLHETFNKNKDIWVEDIYNAIISGDN